MGQITPGLRDRMLTDERPDSELTTEELAMRRRIVKERVDAGRSAAVAQAESPLEKFKRVWGAR